MTSILNLMLPASISVLVLVMCLTGCIPVLLETCESCVDISAQKKWSWLLEIEFLTDDPAESGGDSGMRSMVLCVPSTKNWWLLHCDALLEITMEC